MSDILRILNCLKRPRLLIRAARFGVTDYCRERDLQRLVKSTRMPSPKRAVETLITEENIQEEKRKTGDANYRITRHVSILIALMAEARLMQASLR